MVTSSNYQTNLNAFEGIPLPVAVLDSEHVLYINPALSSELEIEDRANSSDVTTALRPLLQRISSVDNSALIAKDHLHTEPREICLFSASGSKRPMLYYLSSIALTDVNCSQPFQCQLFVFYPLSRITELEELFRPLRETRLRAIPVLRDAFGPFSSANLLEMIFNNYSAADSCDTSRVLTATVSLLDSLIPRFVKIEILRTHPLLIQGTSAVVEGILALILFELSDFCLPRGTITIQVIHSDDTNGDHATFHLQAERDKHSTKDPFRIEQLLLNRLSTKRISTVYERSSTQFLPCVQEEQTSPIFSSIQKELQTHRMNLTFKHHNAHTISFALSIPLVGPAPKLSENMLKE